jgi:hypothetical protein
VAKIKHALIEFGGKGIMKKVKGKSLSGNKINPAHGQVEKQRVVCQNCRFQYSYLYEAKQPQPDAQPALYGNTRNYKNPREAFRACPHCGFVQDWMVAARRRSKMLDFSLVGLAGAVVVLAYLIYQMAVVLLNPLQAGIAESIHYAQMTLGGYLGVLLLAASCYWMWLQWGWRPNREVDTESYEAAVPQSVKTQDAIVAAARYEAAARHVPEKQLPGAPKARPWAALSTSRKMLVASGVLFGFFTLGAPAFSPELAFSLARKGMTMLPFYTGLAIIAAAFVSGFWEFIGQKSH